MFFLNNFETSTLAPVTPGGVILRPSAIRAVAFEIRGTLRLTPEQQKRGRDTAMLMRTIHPRWYLVRSKPRQESRALEHLKRQGFTCYLPVVTVERLRDQRKLEAHEPLFPSYLFIRLNDVNDNWYPIRSTRGVRQIVRFNEYPLPVADEIIDAIQQRLAEAPPQIPYLQPGERVRIMEGPFSNLEAIFLANGGGERVVLLMNVLQKDQALSFPLSSVRKLA